MPGKAVQRSPEDQILIKQDPTALFQKKLDANAGFQLPRGWERADEGQGRVVEKGLDNWQKLSKAFMYAGAGAAAYGTGGMLAPYLSGALGGGAAAGTAATVAGTGAATAAGTGAATAAAGGSGMWGTIIKAALPLIMGQMAGRQSKNAANSAAGGARLQDLMPLLMPLIQQQQQRSNINYGQQTDQYNQAQPLQDAIRKMAMGMMPRSGG